MVVLRQFLFSPIASFAIAIPENNFPYAARYRIGSNLLPVPSRTSAPRSQPRASQRHSVVALGGGALCGQRARISVRVNGTPAALSSEPSISKAAPESMSSGAVSGSTT